MDIYGMLLSIKEVLKLYELLVNFYLGFNVGGMMIFYSIILNFVIWKVNFEENVCDICVWKLV